MAENIENNGCSQRDNAEHEGYVKASRSFNRIWKERDSAQPRLLETILYKDNFNRAYKRVKANKGAPGIDGMTIEEALPYLKEHQQEITDRIYRGKYTPSPVRRVEIPKPDGGVRKLGIPTVIDRTLQQAITQQLVPIYEPLFADGSYGYRPNRSAKDAILKVKEYAEQGYTFAVVLDLSKYFDTLNQPSSARRPPDFWSSQATLWLPLLFYSLYYLLVYSSNSSGSKSSSSASAASMQRFTAP